MLFRSFVFAFMLALAISISFLAARMRAAFSAFGLMTSSNDPRARSYIGLSRRKERAYLTSGVQYSTSQSYLNEIYSLK